MLGQLDTIEQKNSLLYGDGSRETPVLNDVLPEECNAV
jgi:hypothetical protein